MRSTEIVTAFWDEVWNAYEPDAVDRFVADTSSNPKSPVAYLHM